MSDPSFERVVVHFDARGSTRKSYSPSAGETSIWRVFKGVVLRVSFFWLVLKRNQKVFFRDTNLFSFLWLRRVLISSGIPSSHMAQE